MYNYDLKKSELVRVEGFCEVERTPTMFSPETTNQCVESVKCLHQFILLLFEKSARIMDIDTFLN